MAKTAAPAPGDDPGKRKKSSKKPTRKKKTPFQKRIEKTKKSAKKKIKSLKKTVKKTSKKVRKTVKKTKKQVKRVKKFARAVRTGKAFKPKTMRSQLPKSTLAERVEQSWNKAYESQKILRDTGTLLQSIDAKLDVGATGGAKNTPYKNGLAVNIGFDDGYKHSSESGLTIAKLARTHQYGDSKKNLPARPIFIYPDQPTINRCVSAANIFVRQLLKGGQ